MRWAFAFDGCEPLRAEATAPAADAGLTIQLALFPDSLNQDARPPSKPEERLPRVNVTDDLYSLRRAFEEAEKQGVRAARRDMSSSDASPDE